MIPPPGRRKVTIRHMSVENLHMLRRTNVFLQRDHLEKLGALGKSRGLKTAQLIRIAIADYLRRAARQK